MNTRLQIICGLAGGAIAMLAAYPLYIRLVRYHAYDGLIQEAAIRHGLPPALIEAVIWRESRFDRYETGGAGEIGLMQVRRDAAREWAKAENIASFSSADLFDPSTNIAAGTWYLARAIRHWADKDDPLPYALAEYNAGRSNARRWAADSSAGGPRDFIRAIGYPSTRRYVTEVLRRFHEGS